MKKRKELNSLLYNNMKFKRPFLLKNKGYANIKNMDVLDVEKNALDSASSLDDLDFGEQITKNPGTFSKICSVCLVFLLFLSLILSASIILMHMETKLEIRNLAERFKHVEYQNMALNEGNNNLRSSLDHILNNSITINKPESLNFKTTNQDELGSNLLQKSLGLMGSDLGRLKAEISGMKSILNSFKDKLAPVIDNDHKDGNLVSLLSSHMWNQSKNVTLKPIQNLHLPISSNHS